MGTEDGDGEFVLADVEDVLLVVVVLGRLFGVLVFDFGVAEGGLDVFVSDCFDVDDSVFCFAVFDFEVSNEVLEVGLDGVDLAVVLDEGGGKQQVALELLFAALLTVDCLDGSDSSLGVVDVQGFY